MGKRNHLGRLYTRVVPKKVRRHTNKLIPQAAKGKKIVQKKVDRILWGKKRR